MTTTLTPCFLGRPHGKGYDIIRGSDITNESVGVLYYDETEFATGLVLRLTADGEVHLPDSASEVREILATMYGFDLDADADAIIAELA